MLTASPITVRSSFSKEPKFPIITSPLAMPMPLRIFGCEGVEKLLKTIDDTQNYKLFDQNFPIEIHEFAPAEPAHAFDLLAGIKAETISTPHRAESLAIRLTDQSGATIVYTSDTGFSEAVAGIKLPSASGSSISTGRNGAKLRRCIGVGPSAFIAA